MPIGKLEEKDQRVLELVEAYRSLELIHLEIDGAAKELETFLAAPLCLEDSSCGLCCGQLTPIVWSIEATYIISCLLGTDSQSLYSIINRADGWLLEHHKGAPTYGNPKNACTESAFKGLRDEIISLATGQCPFLESKSCLIYRSRPIFCRTYGLTRLPLKECKRKLGIGETENKRAVYTNTYKLQHMVHNLVQPLGQEFKSARFLPTAIIGAYSEERLSGYIMDNKIASAKALNGFLSPSIIWQSQIHETWVGG